MISVRNLTPEAAMNDGIASTEPTDVEAIFLQAVKAWESGELEAFDDARRALFRAAMAVCGEADQYPRQLHALCAEFIAATPDGNVPFMAYAMGRACKALKGLNADTHRDTVRNAINTAHHVGRVLLNHGERGAAIDSAIKLEGMTDALEGFDNTLYLMALDARTDLLLHIQEANEQVSVPFQGASPDLAPTSALEGLFTALCQRLEQLTQVRTDLPDDYVARCKATFTDALLTELEGQGYHSPAFDRLITLRDAWDSGRLESPHVTETTQ